MDMNLFLIDAIGPFFYGYKKDRVNWSKIPFENLEKNGNFDFNKFEHIKRRFAVFVKKAKELGYSAITLDDLAHLSSSEHYPPELQRKIEDYRLAFGELFGIAADAELEVYVTSDVMYYHSSLEGQIGTSVKRASEHLTLSFTDLFTSFPEVKGVILRIGECDAGDVESDFKSQLVIRTPAHARSLLSTLLPVCEQHQRNLVMRTWSVGMYAIGDIAWNRDTFSKVFDSFRSDRLIISMKHGESDFFRYLPLNKLFYRSDHKKIIELQARREYEGFGEFPSFIGWDYDSFAMQLKTAKNVIGCSVWCQTGGWTHFRKLTFLDDSSFWNELNTEVSIQIVKEKKSPEEAIEAFYNERFSDGNWRLLLELLRLSDEVIRELLYINDFSERKIFFRRVRVPPVLWVFWDQIIISHFMRKLLRIYVEDPEYAVSEGRLALDKIARMIELADEIGIEDSGLRFQYDTFQILSAAREYYLLPYSLEIAERLKQLKMDYERKYPDGYEIGLDLSPLKVSSKVMERFLSFALRDKRGYRLLDELIIIRALRWLYPVFSFFEKFWLPSFTNNRAMGIKSIFK